MSITGRVHHTGSTHRGESLCGVTRPWKESEHRALSPGSAESWVVSHATPQECSVALL